MEDQFLKRPLGPAASATTGASRAVLAALFVLMLAAVLALALVQGASA